MQDSYMGVKHLLKTSLVPQIPINIYYIEFIKNAVQSPVPPILGLIVFISYY